MNRRNFIKDASTIIAAGSLLQQCTLVNNQTIQGNIVGANSKVGHLIKNAAGKISTKTLYTTTVIIGGGVSGLSAARYLQQQKKDFLLLELDKEVGGNSNGGSNHISKYPWGAHYIPLPNNDLTEYLQFLQDCNVITGYDESGLPIYNEYYLCFEPQERLYINGFWQEGLMPDFGVSTDDRYQIKSFLAQMTIFKKAKGTDNKYAFTIPVDESSNDVVFTELDKFTMKEWLLQKNYTSTYLHWYCNYCCRDDFGTDYSLASAWAGIHYFAARKGKAANAPPQSVITWPQGNAWLANALKMEVANKILTNHLVTNVSIQNSQIHVQVLDVFKNEVNTIIASNCIIATPQFVASHLLGKLSERLQLVNKHFIYQPWMVANITINNLHERKGRELSWDNVIYQGKALGYVVATHQHIEQSQQKKVLTYYLPLSEKTAKEERLLASKRTFSDWVNIILNDLAPAHENLIACIENIDVWVWGHGMISPHKNFIQSAEKKQMQQNIQHKIFFAHTDLSGVSIFEEAFYQGLKAAKDIIAST
jgi:hypothetical protein